MKYIFVFFLSFFLFGESFADSLQTISNQAIRQDIHTAHSIGKKEVRKNPQKKTPSEHERLQKCLSENAFLKAVYQDNFQQVRFFIQNGAPLNHQSIYFHRTPLFFAQTARTARLLIEAGADIFAVDQKGLTVLSVAVQNNNPYLVEFFIEAGAQVNKRTVQTNQTPLFYARTPDIARLLLQADAEIDITDGKGITPLMNAVATNRAAVVQFLIQKGADVNKRVFKTLQTPLFFAQTSETARLLIQAGADVNAKDINGFTPLMNAVKTNNLYLTEFLIESGADVEARTFQKLQTPLFYAQTPEAARLLLKAGADVNAADKQGYTPLMKAVQKQKVKLIKFLIANGANVHQSAGKAALHKLLPQTVKGIFKVLIGFNDELKDVVSTAAHLKKLWDKKNAVTDYYNKMPNTEETSFSQLATDVYNGTVDTVNGYINTAEHLFDEETVMHLAPTKEIERLIQESEELTQENKETASHQSPDTQTHR